MKDAFAQLPVLLSWHVVLTLLALVAGVVVALPVGVLGAKVKAVRGPALAIASVIQTIPSIALLALIFALLVLLRNALPEGYRFQALGFWPTIIGLTMYCLLPLLRNTVTGLLGVDPAAVEAARGLGMNGWQRLSRVELPLALPVLVAGLRTATVWTVGVATLSTPIGQKSLGDYVFGGMQTLDTTSILFGCVAAALLAIALDQLAAAMETAALQRRPRVLAGLLAALLAIGAAAGLTLYAKGEVFRGGDVVRVGAKNFNEQFILAHVIADRLESVGIEAQRVESLGSMTVYEALAAGEIDAYVDYTGTIWANAMQRTDNPGRDAVLAGMTQWLKAERGITALGLLGFENAYAVAVLADEADARGITTIDDLARTGRFRLGSDIEFFKRPEWTRLRDDYGLQNAEQVSMSPTNMYPAIVAGEVDAITAFTSDGRNVAYKLRLLDDPRQSLPPYDAVLLLSASAAADPAIVAALRPLVGAIPLETMQRANLLVDVENQTPRAAADWLAGQIDDGAKGE